MNILQDQSEASPLYPFLHIYREKEAILLGVNLSNRYQQELFKYIEKQSTISNAGRGSLFTIKKQHVDNLKVSDEDLALFLNRLVEDKLVAQIIGINYDQDLNHIQIMSYYASHPHPDKGGSIDGLFERILTNSVNAVKKWIENRQPFTNNDYEALLQTQFKGDNHPKYDFRDPVIDFNEVFFKNNYPIKVSEQMLNYTIKEITGELVRKNLITRLQNNKYLLVKESEAIPFFETAKGFLLDKILPKACKNAKLAHKIDKINYEEMNYSLDDVEKPQTIRFIAKKAKEVKSSYNADNRANREYAGSLAVDIILGIENVVERKYSEIWKERTFELKGDFKKELNDITKDLPYLIRAIPQKEVLNYPQDVWRSLLVDKEIFYTKWETEETTYHFFIGRAMPVIKKLVGKMLDLPPRDYWKVLALRDIIDKNDIYFRSLLNDNFFLNDYGFLLRKVYINLMPWYYKGLFIIPLPVFQDMFFTKAKDFLAQQQSQLSKENHERHKEFISLKQEERKHKLSTERENMLFLSLVEKLDNFYFVEKTIPHVGAIKSLFPELDSKEFSGFLTQRKFRLVPLGTKYEKDMDILLHPVDKDWQDKKIGIMNFSRQLIDKLTTNFLNEAEKLLLLKARKLKSFLEKTTTNPEIKLVEKPKEDPYQKLEKEIKNLKAKEKKTDKEEEGNS
ncbi:MAG: hypothetical protein AAF518_16325 [Spirochaetota bacterium]